MVNFGNVDINPYIPCLIEDEFLKENIDRYTQVCLEIMKLNFDKDSSYEETESELCNINICSDRKLQLIADYFDQKNIDDDTTLFSIYVCIYTKNASEFIWTSKPFYIKC